MKNILLLCCAILLNGCVCYQIKTPEDRNVTILKEIPKSVAVSEAEYYDIKILEIQSPTERLFQELFDSPEFKYQARSLFYK